MSHSPMFLIIIILSFFKFSDFCIPTQQIDDDETTTTTTSTTTTPAPTCLSGWTSFDRGTYIWCMKVYLASLTYEQAEAYCASLNSAAVPSGFQTANEDLTMMAIAQTLKPSYQKTVAIYIGAKRTTACLKSTLTTTCTATNSFNWTDGYTTGSAAFDWTSGNPNNDGLVQDLVIVYSASGQMDDVSDTAKGGVVCGMKAT